jgi:CUG-BP- and ETR3-like factor
MFKNSETKIYPDKDSIKMFVGQLPENIELIKLKQLFEKFGKVYEIKMIKNLKTGESKNCCFVKYYTRESALNAQTNLNNKCVENSDKPIQMKPADFNLKNRKIFVGKISSSDT